ncbi:hypothetical protein G6F43_001349 [Rhizopus delemar]|nr:hypothetical protein G6F43_001349 [Rhizopus delemar]
MNAQFLYEDGQGNIMNEQNTEKTLASDEGEQHSDPINSTEMQSESRPNNEEEGIDARKKLKKRQARSVYTDQEKESFFKLKFEKCLSASAAAKQLGINARTAQRWSQEYDKDPDGVFDNKKRKTERKPALQEEHKRYLQDYIDENPTAVLDEVMDNLTRTFGGPKISKSSVYNFLTTDCSLAINRVPSHRVDSNEIIQQGYEWALKLKQSYVDFLTNCVFINESAFHINMRRSLAWSRKGNSTAANTPANKAKATTIFGAISASRLIKVTLGMPQLAKEAIIDYQSAESNRGSIVAGHYLNFIKSTLDEMDKHPEMKGYYLVMDNAPVHNLKDIGEYVNSRGYRYVYLPLYPLDINPMELFWTVAKNKIKRSRLTENETISSRIKDACDSLTPDDFQGFVHHSVSCIDKIVEKELNCQ